MLLPAGQVEVGVAPLLVFREEGLREGGREGGREGRKDE